MSAESSIYPTEADAAAPATRCHIAAPLGEASITSHLLMKRDAPTPVNSFHPQEADLVEQSLRDSSRVVDYQSTHGHPARPSRESTYDGLVPSARSAKHSLGLADTRRYENRHQTLDRPTRRAEARSLPQNRGTAPRGRRRSSATDTALPQWQSTPGWASRPDATADASITHLSVPEVLSPSTAQSSTTERAQSSTSEHQPTLSFNMSFPSVPARLSLSPSLTTTTTTASNETERQRQRQQQQQQRSLTATPAAMESFYDDGKRSRRKADRASKSRFTADTDFIDGNNSSTNRPIRRLSSTRLLPIIWAKRPHVPRLSSGKKTAKQNSVSLKRSAEQPEKSLSCAHGDVLQKYPDLKAQRDREAAAAVKESQKRFNSQSYSHHFVPLRSPQLLGNRDDSASIVQPEREVEWSAAPTSASELTYNNVALSSKLHTGASRDAEGSGSHAKLRLSSIAFLRQVSGTFNDGAAADRQMQSTFSGNCSNTSQSPPPPSAQQQQHPSWRRPSRQGASQVSHERFPSLIDSTNHRSSFSAPRALSSRREQKRSSSGLQSANSSFSTSNQSSKSAKHATTQLEAGGAVPAVQQSLDMVLQRFSSSRNWSCGDPPAQTYRSARSENARTTAPSVSLSRGRTPRTFVEPMPLLVADAAKPRQLPLSAWKKPSPPPVKSNRLTVSPPHSSVATTVSPPVRRTVPQPPPSQPIVSVKTTVVVRRGPKRINIRSARNCIACSHASDPRFEPYFTPATRRGWPMAKATKAALRSGSRSPSPRRVDPPPMPAASESGKDAVLDLEALIKRKNSLDYLLDRHGFWGESTR